MPAKETPASGEKGLDGHTDATALETDSGEKWERFSFGHSFGAEIHNYFSVGNEALLLMKYSIDGRHTDKIFFDVVDRKFAPSKHATAPGTITDFHTFYANVVRARDEFLVVFWRDREKGARQEVHRTQDFKTWTKMGDDPFAATKCQVVHSTPTNISNLAFFADHYWTFCNVMGSTFSLVKSRDGSKWDDVTELPIEPSGHYGSADISLFTFKGKLWAYAKGRTIVTSDDGLTWRKTDVKTPELHYTGYLAPILYGGKLWGVADRAVMNSNDGFTWQPVDAKVFLEKTQGDWFRYELSRLVLAADGHLYAEVWDWSDDVSRLTIWRSTK